MAVNNVQPHEQRYTQSRLLDGDALHFVYGLGTDQIEQIADGPAADGFGGVAGDDRSGDCVAACRHGQLAELFFQGHRVDQLFDTAHRGIIT